MVKTQTKFLKYNYMKTGIIIFAVIFAVIWAAIPEGDY